jgi:hypothetical protein
VGSMRGTAVALLALVAMAPGIVAQEGEGAREPYFRAVQEFFGLGPTEIGILRDWGLPPDDVPVVLFVARRAGISSDAIVALRRSGRSWTQILARYRIGAEVLHLPLPDRSSAGRLAAAYRQFRSVSVEEWSGVRLSDDDIVALVNVRVLSQTLGRSPEEILARADGSRAFFELYLDFIG